MLGPGWRSRIRLVAATSSSVEVSGCWTTVTLYPSLTRMSSTGFQPEPSTKAPCTSTMFLIGAASTGTAVPARTRKAAADTKEFLRLLKIIIRSFSLFCSVSCSTNRNGDPNVDVAPNCIGIAAHFVIRLDQIFGLLLIDSGERDRECGGQHEAARV